LTSKPVKKRSFRLVLNGKPIVEFVVVETKSGFIAMPATKGPKAHLHVYPRDGQLHRLVTHEKYPKGHGRRHTQKASIAMEEFADPIWTALAPKDNPPPTITSLANREEMDKLVAWFEQIAPGLIHPPSDRTIRLMRGPLGELLERFDGQFDPDWSMEISDFRAYYRRLKPKSKADLFEIGKETDLSMTGRRIGFSPDIRKIIILISEGLVFELPWRNLERVGNVNIKLLGFDGFIRTLRRSRKLPYRTKRR